MNYCKRIMCMLMFILIISLFTGLPSDARQGGHGNWNKQFSTMQKRWDNRRDHWRNNWSTMQEHWQDGWNNIRERQQDRREHMRENWDNMWNSDGGHRGMRNH
jgi:hypothetical protein